MFLQACKLNAACPDKKTLLQRECKYAAVRRGYRESVKGRLGGIRTVSKNDFCGNSCLPASVRTDV